MQTIGEAHLDEWKQTNFGKTSAGAFAGKKFFHSKMAECK